MLTPSVSLLSMESFTDAIGNVLPDGSVSSGKSSFDNGITEADAPSASLKAVNESISALE